MIKATDGFFMTHKTKITLISAAFIFICYTAYCFKSLDTVYMKIVMGFIALTVFAGVFFGIKFILLLKNRFAPLKGTAGYIFDMLCVLSALFLTAAFFYGFVLSFEGFNLIFIPAFLAFFDAVVSARIKIKKRKN